ECAGHSVGINLRQHRVLRDVSIVRPNDRFADKVMPPRGIRRHGAFMFGEARWTIRGKKKSEPRKLADDLCAFQSRIKRLAGRTVPELFFMAAQKFFDTLTPGSQLRFFSGRERLVLFRQNSGGLVFLKRSSAEPLVSSLHLRQ